MHGTVSFAAASAAFALAGLTAQGTELASAPAATERLAAVEQLAARDELDAATVELWRLARDLDPAADDAVARSVRAALARLEERVDPLREARQALARATAADLLELARQYQRRRWNASALELLELATAHDLATVAKSLDYVRKQLEPKAEPKAAKEPAARPDPRHGRDLLPRLDRGVVQGEWTTAGDTVLSPPQIEPFTAYWLARQLEHKDETIEIDVEIGAVAGSATLMFGALSVSRYMMFEIAQHPASRTTSCYLYEWQGEDTSLDEPLEAKSALDLQTAADAFAGKRRLRVEVRGSRVRCFLDDRPAGAADMSRPAFGTLGLMVNASSDSRAPVRFSNLRLSPLPPERPTRGDPAPPAVSLEAELAAAIASADEQAGGRDREGACRTLRALRGRLAELPSETVRAALGTEIQRRIEALDPLAAPRREVGSRIAGRFVELAERHRATARPACALELLLEAQRYDAATAEPALAALRQELEVPAEQPPAVPLDDTSLREHFERGRVLWGRDDWGLDDAGVATPELRYHAIVLRASARPVGDLGAVSVRARLEGSGGMVGLAFGVRGGRDLWLLAWRPHRSRGTIELLQLEDGVWRTLASADAAFSDAARREFATLAVERHGDRLRATVGAAPPLEVEAKETLAGALGLVLEGVDGGEARGRFRGLAVTPR